MKKLLTSLSLLIAGFCFSQEIEVITQEKTQGVITILSYSPDGTLLASGSAKETSVKIWDINSGKIIGKLEGHEAFTTALMFNDDGTKLVTSANDNYLILWDIVEWKIIDSIKMTSPVIWMSRNPDKKDVFYTGAENGNVTEWKYADITSPVELFKDDDVVTRLDCNGGHLAIGDKSGVITLFNLETRVVMRSKKVHQSAVKGLTFYDNGFGLISTGGGGLVHLWKINDLSESKHIQASANGISAFDANVAKNRFVTVSNSRVISVWDFEGNQIFEFKDKLEDYSNSEPIRALQISPDGSTVASSGFSKSKSFRTKKNDNVIRIWDMNRGSIYKLLEGQVNPIYTFDFHPSKNEIVTLGEDRILTFWDFNIAEKYGEFELPEPKREIPPAMKFWSKENISGRGGSLVENIKTGNIGGIRRPKIDPVKKGKNLGKGIVKRTFSESAIVKFSSKGNFLLTKLPKDEIRYYSLTEKKPTYIGPLWSYQTNINEISCSPNEEYLAVLGSGDTAVSIINLLTGEFERKLDTPGPKGRLNVLFEANSIAFSPDGMYLAVCFNTSQTYVYDTRYWSMVFQNELPNQVGLPKGAFVNFSEDGQHMVVSSSFGVYRYKTGDWSITNSDKLKINGKSESLDKPSNYALTHKDNYFYIENIYTGNHHQVLRSTGRDITHVSISPNGKFGITTKSGQFLIVNPETGKQEILLVADGDNFIFKTDENFYKVSKEGYDLVTFRIGNQAYPFEQFDAIFNRPDLVLTKLGCTDLQMVALYKMAYEKRIKKLGLKPTTQVTLTDIPQLVLTNLTEIPAITSTESVNVNMNMSDHTALMSYNVFVNNVPVYGKNGKSLSGVDKAELTEEVSLIHGVNKIQIACRNSNGYESLMKTFYVEKAGPEPKRDLYLVTIGTSKYKDNRYNLQYAAKDGKDLAALMTANANGLYNSVKSKSLYNEQVTATNITELFHFLKQSKPDDVVLVFVAGHGVLDANFDYYFGTYDMNFNDPANKGLAYERLEGILDGIKAIKKILIMDTCHSGEIDKEDAFFVASNDDNVPEDDISFRSVGPAVEENAGATPSRLSTILFNDLRRGTGSTVISSAGGAEYAMESDEWKNGLFTFCMLKGLKEGTADLDKNGEIMLLELQEYVVEAVRKYSKGKQVPNTRIKNLELDFRVW